MVLLIGIIGAGLHYIAQAEMNNTASYETQDQSVSRNTL
jgi:hypothetical protein